MMSNLEDMTVHAAVSDWAAREWKSRADSLRVLLSEALLFATEHDAVCDMHVEPRLGCNCGLDIWRGMVTRVLEKTPAPEPLDDDEHL